MKSAKHNPDEQVITPAVAAITNLNFSGNIIPHGWWQADRLKLKTGKPNALAILILSDICYWYRAVEERDETTGAVIRARRRFKADKLQRSYKDWADQFGFSKQQVQRAVSFLIERGLVKRELRTVITRGMPLSNVTFFEPVVNVIKEITCLPPIIKFDDTSHQQRGEVSLKLMRPIISRDETYTEITTENISENTQRESVCAEPEIAADAAHTRPSSAPQKKKSRKGQKQNGSAKERIVLAANQSAALAILCAFFPTLKANNSEADLAQFILETGYVPWGAVTFCSWLDSRDRDFSFMKVSLLKQLTDEFNACPSGEFQDAEDWCEARLGRMEAVMNIYDEWHEQAHRGPEPTAA